MSSPFEKPGQAPSDPGDRDAQRLAQYRRARELPDHGFQGWRNPGAQSADKVDVSVLITCYNYERLIERALLSVFKAARPPLRVEVTLVDDSSTDGSLARARGVLQRAPIPMRILKTGWNVGVSRARNLGLAHCRGEFVFILDADNTIHPEALSNLHACAREQHADAAYGPVPRVTEDGRFWDIVSHRPFDPEYLFGEGNYIDAMALFRRRSLLSIGGYDVELLRVIAGWEDYAVWLEFARRGYRVAFHPATVGYYLIKPDSMVQKITQREMEQARVLLKRRYGERRSAVASAGGAHPLAQFLRTLEDGLEQRFHAIYRKPRRDRLAVLCDLYGAETEQRSQAACTYTDFYARLFDHCRLTVRRVFECCAPQDRQGGATTARLTQGHAASLRVWRDYFPSALVYGCDVDDDTLPGEERIRVSRLDQRDPGAIRAYWRAVGERGFDLMIDGGPSTFDAGSTLFERSIDRLSPSGIYVIQSVTPADLIRYRNFFEGTDYSVDYVVMQSQQRPLGDSNLVVIRNPADS